MLNSISSAGVPAGEYRRRARRLPPGFYSVHQLLAVSPVGKSTLYSAIKRGELPANRWRNRICVAEDAFREWMTVRPLPVEPAAENAAEEPAGSADHE